MWDVQDLRCSRLGMFGMADFQDMGCWACSMFSIWDVGMRDAGNVRSLRCGVLKRCRVCYMDFFLKNCIPKIMEQK